MKHYSLWLGLSSALALSGCTTENPAWLTQTKGLYCLGGVDSTCLTEFGSSAFQAATASPEPDIDAMSQLAFGISIDGGEIPLEKDQVLDDRTAAFGEAGKRLRSENQVAIHAINEMKDTEAKAYALSRLLIIRGASMPDEQVNTVLNELFALSKDQYLTGLWVKLPALLQHGDYERAAVLRNVLLDGAPQNQPFSMLALVASAYTIAGLKDDAWGIAKAESEKGRELTDDDRKLINAVMEAASTNYPAPQVFFDFTSDQVRLDAYLTISALAHQVGKPELASRALNDAVKFIQKSSVKIDRKKALANILYLANRS